jgi:hypothetical protein
MVKMIAPMAPQAVLSAYRNAKALYRRLRRRTVFEQIYRENLWGDGESRSGTGSGITATEKIRHGLLDAIQRLDVQSMIDAPCGDFYWVSTLNLEQHLRSYIGFDIVPDVISRNKNRWAGENISFELADLVKSVPPMADLILCRHLLIHLPLADCLRVLHNFKASGSRYLMITNQPQAERNDEILFTGSYRPINLYLPPFNFPQPIWAVDDSQPQGHLEAAIFRLATLNV